MKTDFELYGLGERVDAKGAAWVATVDLESFAENSHAPWTQAMRYWAERSRERDWRFSFFVALEDVALLRSQGAERYEPFLDAVRALHRQGSRFFPHNHWAVNLDTGEGARRDGRREPSVHGYRKRPSMFYDAVHRQGLSPGAWLEAIRSAYLRFLEDAEIPRPEALAFRAGGWDYGSTAQEVRDYVEALAGAGFDIDSSASSGQYGTRGWRVGAPFGENLLRLRPGLLEVAPSWSLNRAPSMRFLRSASSLMRLAGQPRLWRRSPRGALVAVLHFDHLFHAHRRGDAGYFAVDDPATVIGRIDALFARLGSLRKVLRFPSLTLEDIRADESTVRIGLPLASGEVEAR